MQNELNTILPSIRKKNPAIIENPEKEEITLPQLRIYHVKITHSYLLKQEEPSWYPTGQTRRSWNVSFTTMLVHNNIQRNDLGVSDMSSF